MATIKLTTAKKEVTITLRGFGNAAINWGDSKISQTVALSMGKTTVLTYTYSVVSTRTITITGDVITVLGCSENELTGLSVKECTTLTSLGCYYNQLTTLDVSGCNSLETLACSNNLLDNLNISGCIALVTLSCHNNRLKTLNLGSSRTRLQPQKKEEINTLPTKIIETALKPVEPQLPDRQWPFEFEDKRFPPERPDLEVEIKDYGKIEIVVPPDYATAVYPKLRYLYCSDNQLTTLDLTGCPMLEKVFSANNLLTTLMVKGLTFLQHVSCHHNRLTDINIDGCCLLRYILCLAGQNIPLSISGMKQQNSTLTIK